MLRVHIFYKYVCIKPSIKHNIHMHKPPRNNIKIKYMKATSKGNWFRMKSDTANSAPSVYDGVAYVYFKHYRDICPFVSVVFIKWSDIFTHWTVYTQFSRKRVEKRIVCSRHTKYQRVCILYVCICMRYWEVEASLISERRIFTIRTCWWWNVCSAL